MVQRRRSCLTGKAADPAWRHARGVKAGAASRAATERRRETEGEKYTTKGIAWQAGYRRGYQTAFTWWRRKYLRDGLRRVKGTAG